MAELQKTSASLCKTCKYSFYGYDMKNNGANRYLCEYTIVTGKMRGDKVGWCDKYEKGKRKMTMYGII